MDGVVLQPEATVTGALNYMKPMAKRPVNYTYQPPEGTPWRSAENESRALPIRNGRLLAGRLSLDREGFELVQHASAVKDFYDSEELRSVYYPESERLVAVELYRQVFAADTIPPRFENVVQRADGSPRTVTYSLAPPGGFWVSMATSASSSAAIGSARGSSHARTAAAGSIRRSGTWSRPCPRPSDRGRLRES